MTITVDVSDLVDAIDDDIQVVEETIAELVRAVAREFIKTVVPATPIDTGKARRNWQVTFLAPATNVLNGVDASVGGQFTVAEQVSRIDTYKFSATGFAPALWIANNVPYIGLLNEGTSQQAPAGFVESALQAAERAAPRNIGNLR